MFRALLILVCVLLILLYYILYYILNHAILFMFIICIHTILFTMHSCYNTIMFIKFIVLLFYFIVLLYSIVQWTAIRTHITIYYAWSKTIQVHTICCGIILFYCTIYSIMQFILSYYHTIILSYYHTVHCVIMLYFHLFNKGCYYIYCCCLWSS
jgi:hypothetical protein